MQHLRQGQLKHPLWLIDVPTTIPECLLILPYCCTIQFNSTLDTLGFEWQQPQLIRNPEQEDVCGHLIPEQIFGNGTRINIDIPLVPGVLVNRAPNRRFSWEE